MFYPPLLSKLTGVTEISDELQWRKLPAIVTHAFAFRPLLSAAVWGQWPAAGTELLKGAEQSGCSEQSDSRLVKMCARCVGFHSECGGGGFFLYMKDSWVVVSVWVLTADSRSGVFIFCLSPPDIGVGSDSVCARHSSAHRIKSFESLASQASLGRSSKLLQNQFRSLVRLTPAAPAAQLRNTRLIVKMETMRLTHVYYNAIVSLLLFSLD